VATGTQLTGSSPLEKYNSNCTVKSQLLLTGNLVPVTILK